MPITQFVYNSAVYEVTKLVLFKVVLRYIPEAYYKPLLGQKDAYFAEVDA